MKDSIVRKQYDLVPECNYDYENDKCCISLSILYQAIFRALYQLGTAKYAANDLGFVSGTSPGSVFYVNEPPRALLTLISFKSLPHHWVAMCSLA